VNTDKLNEIIFSHKMQVTRNLNYTSRLSIPYPARFNSVYHEIILLYNISGKWKNPGQ